MLKIAICDDNTVQLNIIREELEKNMKKEIAYDVDTFCSASDFTEVLQSGDCLYDIIFMDIDLGDSSVSGIDLVHKVNFLNQSCQIIYISQHLEYAPDVYDTQHIYFLNKERLTELFNKDMVKYCVIPFEEKAYSKYLEAIVDCKVSHNSYPSNFINKLKTLGDMVYPLTSKQSYGRQTNSYSKPNNGFSSSMNSTLNKMKKKY